MVRKRADPWYKAADREYPVRVRFRLPEAGMYQLSLDPQEWLRANLGPKMWQWGPAGWSGKRRQATHYYFRLLEDAQRFVAAFPQLELADDVAAPVDTTPAEPVPHQGWSCLGRGSPSD
jgi:hypothetical protein